MFVLIEVCCNERPIASATLINRLAKRVSKIGSGPSESDIVVGGIPVLEVVGPARSKETRIR